MTTVFILKHLDSIRKAILKTDFLNYVNDEVLSQYDDKDILHSVIFNSKNMIFAECNYEIYDKKLLIIICCLKHWHFELKCTNILIKIFINHLNLKYFMIIKELIRWQAKWAEKLSKYNFKIIYQSRKQNLKVDALIRMSNVKSVEANDDCKLYQHQMPLSEDRFELQSIEDDQKADQDLTQILLKFRSVIKLELSWVDSSQLELNLRLSWVAWTRFLKIVYLLICTKFSCRLNSNLISKNRIITCMHEIFAQTEFSRTLI